MNSSSSNSKLATVILLIIVAGFVYWKLSARGAPEAISVSPRSDATPAAVVSTTPTHSPLSQISPLPVNSPKPEDLKKVEVLAEILKSRNDNDPRLDTDFNNLSPAAKQLLRNQYQALPTEGRNERGTIVFLLGRNLTTPQDFGFLNTVVTEPPCLSMADCAHEAKIDAHDAAHLEMGTDVSLNYPQMVALVSIGNLLAAGTPAHPDWVKQTLDLAAKSPVPMVASKAQSLLAQLRH